jgi:hypothetical protein
VDDCEPLPGKLMTTWYGNGRSAPPRRVGTPQGCHIGYMDGYMDHSGCNVIS